MTASMSLRRLRQSSAIRELVREVRVVPEQLIQPHFVVEGLRSREPVPGMTDVHRETGDTLAATIESDLEAGVAKVLLFGVPSEKRDADFSHDFTAGQIESLRRRFGRALWIGVDVCLCSHTRHGHCGVLDREGEHVENGATVTELARAATLFAEAGADCVAPSDMMDGRIGALRAGLDAAGLERTLVMSYAAKFHSRFYGPFRVAAESAPQSGPKDRATYQIDPARPNDALQCALRDAREGADILMVKPGLPYLDVLAELARRVELPWAVYQVSGEYAAIELLAAHGLTARAQAHVEIWTAFVRAGASIIITYGARHARQWLEASRS